jgi:hypothetical protein
MIKISAKIGKNSLFIGLIPWQKGALRFWIFESGLGVNFIWKEQL